MPEPVQPSILHTLLTYSAQAYAVRGELSDSPSGKRNATYTTIRQPLPERLFLSHFEGKQCISVCPLVGGGDMCQWGALDIDNYGDPSLLVTIRRALELFQIPAFVELSKSQGVHVYIMLEKPIMARLFRKALKKLAIWIGQPRAEIRPAQDSINLNEGDVGTAMVLPGFGIGLTKAEGMLSACATTADHFMGLLAEGEFVDGPPCLFPLQRLNERAGEWSNRNDYLYQLGVFLRYKYPSDFADRIRAFNDDVIANPSPQDEVENLIKQLSKNGRCHYACKKPQFEAVCNKAECQVRKFGISARDGAGELLVPEGITKIATDPPTWFVSLMDPGVGETRRVKFTTNQLLNVGQFKRRIMEVLSILPTLPAQKEWEAMIQRLLESVETVPVPFENTEEAKLFDDLYTFCTSSMTTTDPEKLLQGRIHTEKSGEDAVVFRFRQVDFINYLSRAGRGVVDSGKILGQLQQLAWMGKLRQESVTVPPVTLSVWVMETKSKLLALKAELDADKEPG